MQLRTPVLFLFLVTAAPGQVPNKTSSIGALENGVYHNKRSGIQFTVPSDWVLVSQEWASAGAQTVLLRDTVTNVIVTAWMKARNIDPANIPAVMERRLDTRTMQRNDFEGYRYRAESVQHSTVGGQQALSAVADYLRAGQKMVESSTWIDGEKSRVVFTARLPESDLGNFESRFDTLIQSAVVP
jgi:hypothetical protein